MVLQILIFYLLTWFLILFLGGLQGATGVIPPQIGLPQLAPGLAALVSLVIFRKKRFQISVFPAGIPWNRYLMAALVPTSIGLAIYLISSQIQFPPLPRSELWDSQGLLLLWMPLGALGEELGWRSYLHRLLDSRLRGLISSLIVGLLWLPIHVHFFTQPPLYLFFLAVMFISQSLILYKLIHDARFSLALAAIFHWSINLINLLILDWIFQVTFMIISGLVWAIAATVIAALNREVFFDGKTSEV